MHDCLCMDVYMHQLRALYVYEISVSAPLLAFRAALQNSSIIRRPVSEIIDLSLNIHVFVVQWTVEQKQQTALTYGALPLQWHSTTTSNLCSISPSFILPSALSFHPSLYMQVTVFGIFVSFVLFVFEYLSRRLLFIYTLILLPQRIAVCVCTGLAEKYKRNKNKTWKLFHLICLTLNNCNYCITLFRKLMCI